MENSQNYTIQWVDHLATLKNSLFNCLVDTNFSDIFLSSQGIIVPCHKVVLAATSNFFQKLFKSDAFRDSRERQTVVLSNIRVVDLIAVLNYAYVGCVEIPHEQVEMFIHTATFLEMKGLEDFHQQQGQQSSHQQRDQPSIQVHQSTSPMPSPQPSTSRQTAAPTGQQTSVPPVQLPSIQEENAEQEIGLNPEPSTPNRVDQVSFGLPESNSSLIPDVVPVPVIPSTAPNMPLSSSADENSESLLLQVDNIPVPDQEKTSNGKVKSSRRRIRPPSYLAEYQFDNGKPRSSRRIASDNERESEGNETTVGRKYCGTDTSQLPGGSKTNNHEMKLVKNPNREEGKVECPICLKFFNSSYVATHIKKIHGVSVDDNLPEDV